MTLQSLSDSSQNYLKAVYSLSEWSQVTVTASAIADRVGVKLSTVSDAIRKLAEKGLVDHEPYGAITLTQQGRVYALEMVRRHRLIETFLVQVLHYRWDQVHEEADALEHSVSDLMVERLDALLGFPSRDPHGDPIPENDGDVVLPQAVLLTEAAPSSTVTVERVSDDDPGLLQYLTEHGVQFGTIVKVQPAVPYADTVTVLAEGEDTPLTISQSAAAAMWVSTPAVQ